MISKSGIINILKPTGLTSSDVVVRVRKILSQFFGEKIKVGHLGTLDPAGSGVLPIAYGSATRLFDYFIKKTKIYRAYFVFGLTTDTLDSSGKVTASCLNIPTKAQIQQVLAQFVGDIKQIPPAYSAISIDGKRAYDLAREGKAFVIPERTVKIYDIKIVSAISNGFIFDITCEGGTYIRTLCDDLAKALGTLAYMPVIIRLASGQFDVYNSCTTDELRENCEKFMIPMAEILSEFPSYYTPKELQEKVLNGVKIVIDEKLDCPTTIYCGDTVVGIGDTCDGFLAVKTRLWES